MNISPKLIRTINKLCNVHTEEWPRVLLLYLLLFVINTGIIWGETTIIGSFLDLVGTEKLPWVFIAIAIASIPAMAVYTAFADRTANDKLLIAILLIGAGGVALGRILLGLGLAELAYPLLYFILFVPFEDIYGLHWATYVNGMYDIRAAKRITPLLISSARIAGIVAGFSISYLNLILSQANIIMIWFGSLILAALIIWAIPQLLKKGRRTREQSGLIAISRPSQNSYQENIKEGYRYVSQSRFLGWMAVSTFFLILLIVLINFQTFRIFELEFQTSQDISNFVGQLTAIANIFALPMLLFGMGRVINSIGLGNANLIYPLMVLGINGSLLLFPNRFMAALGHLERTTFLLAFRNPTDSLLYNAVPVRVKGRARAFIGGFISPIGSLIGGVLLALPFKDTIWFVPTLIGIASVAYVISAIIIRREYALALIKMLEEEDYSFILSQEGANLTVSDPKALAKLEEKLRTSESYELTVFMAKLISDIGGKAATPILTEAIQEAKEGKVRAGILNVVATSTQQSKGMRQLYQTYLSDPSEQVREAAFLGLEQASDAGDSEFQMLALEMISDSNLTIQEQVLTTLANTGKIYNLPRAMEALNKLLADEDEHRRTAGVRVLGQIPGDRAISQLTNYLTDPSDEVRLEATLAVEQHSLDHLNLNLIGQISKQMASLLQDPIERVRETAVSILGQLGTRRYHKVVIQALADESPKIRAAAVDALAKAGKSVIPTIHPQLDSPNAQLRKMASVILSRINKREYGPLVNTHITSNLLMIYQNYGRLVALEPCLIYPSISVLRDTLQEQNEQLIDEIFYLLTAIHPNESVRIIAESLTSESSRIRANAAEALESLTSPQTTKMIAPLFDPKAKAKNLQLLKLGEETWDLEYTNTLETIKQLLKDPENPWFRAIMTFALGEMAGGLLKKTPDEASSLLEETEPIKPLRRKREVSSTTLFALGDDGTKPSSKPSKKRRDRRRRQPKDLLNILEDQSNDSSDQAKADTPKKDKRNRRRRRQPKDLLNILDDTPASSSDDVNDNVPDDDERNDPKSRRPQPKDLLNIFSKEKGDTSSPKPQSNVEETPASPYTPFVMSEIATMLDDAFADSVRDVQLAARAAHRIIAGLEITDMIQEDETLLSIIERIIFLKEVPFFEGMTVEQLKVLANVCEEELFEEDTRIFNEGDPGGALYVVISGRVGIEQEKRKGSFARLATIEAHSYFGEANLFDNQPRSDSAIALQDTLLLRLRREPLIALARQYPELSLELINVLSKRLQEANDRVADLTRTRTRKLQKFYDAYD